MERGGSWVKKWKFTCLPPPPSPLVLEALVSFCRVPPPTDSEPLAPFLYAARAAPKPCRLLLLSSWASPPPDMSPVHCRAALKDKHSSPPFLIQCLGSGEKQEHLERSLAAAPSQEITPASEPLARRHPELGRVPGAGVTSLLQTPEGHVAAPESSRGRPVC